jgi:hypothetical protein
MKRSVDYVGRHLRIKALFFIFDFLQTHNFKHIGLSLFCYIIDVVPDILVKDDSRLLLI